MAMAALALLLAALGAAAVRAAPPNSAAQSTDLDLPPADLSIDLYLPPADLSVDLDLPPADLSIDLYLPPADLAVAPAAAQGAGPSPRRLGSGRGGSEFPHQASVQIANDSEAKPRHVCGGALIDRRWVLTSALCVADAPDGARVEVLLGVLDLQWSSGQRLPVSDIIVHEDFDLPGCSVRNDIALLKLARPAWLTWGAVETARLPSRGSIPSGEVTISGWGATNEDLRRANWLQMATVPIVDSERCSQFLRDTGPRQRCLTDAEVCAGFLDSVGAKACEGDGGSPVTQWEHGEAVVVGIVSWGDDECSPTKPYPSVFARTSAFVDWIEHKMKTL